MTEPLLNPAQGSGNNREAIGSLERTNCSWCHKDLTSSSNSEAYRLRLTSEDISGTGPVTDCGDEPEINQDHYFCHLKCLRHWAIQGK